MLDVPQNPGAGTRRLWGRRTQVPRQNRLMDQEQPSVLRCTSLDDVGYHSRAKAQYPDQDVKRVRYHRISFRITIMNGCPA
jgi:hypothetical protein